MSNNFFTISIFIFNVLLICVYFSKDRVKSFETTTYKYLVISNFVSSLLALGSYLTIKYSTSVPILNEIISKLLLVSYLMWLLIFTCYLLGVSDRKIFRKNNIFKNNLVKILCLIFFVAISICPLEYYNSDNIIYSYGVAANVVYVLAFIMVILWFIIIIKNRKEFFNKKYYPLYGLIVLGSIVIYIQHSKPELLLLTYLIGFITFLMYFTIENPDLKLINELNVAKTNLEKANNVKTDFLKSMSHEIRTPMNQIIGCASILEYEDNLSSEGKETLHDLSTATNSLLDVCSGIINVSQIESGNANLEISEYNPGELFDEIIKLNSKLVNGKDITFEKEYNNLPDKLYGDKEKVKQIVSNIFNNAVKYTEKGYVKLKVNSSLEENKCNLEIIIEDTGKGIKEENKDLIFDKFGRETKDTDKLGLGLGLTIAKSLVEMLNGKIEFTSEEGKGTTFAVNIKQDLEEVNKVDLSEKKVLILHTSNILKTYIRKILEKYEIKVYEASKCSEALEFLEDNKCDVVLTDILIEKEMSVKEFALISKFEKELNIKIITIGRVENTTDHDYEGYAFDGYVSENLNENEIINKIKEVLK